jgi:hypothetical protein
MRVAGAVEGAQCLRNCTERTREIFFEGQLCNSV